MAQKETQRYSYIYNALVASSNDFIGLVAYSIYKQEKIAYVKNFEKKENRPPEPAELQEFHSLAHCRLEQYKALAANTVNEFYKDVYKSAWEKLDENFSDRVLAEAKKYKNSWFAGICQSILGTFFYSLLIGIIIVLLLYSEYGLSWVLSYIANTQQLP